MMLESVLGSRARIRVMSVLLARDYDSMSGIARDCGMSKKIIYETLNELEKTGIVKIERSRKRWKISIDDGMRKAELSGLKRLFSMDDSLSIDCIVDALPKDKIRRIIWFGSTARGEATPTSDIDITVVSRLQKYETYRILESHVRQLEKIIRRRIHLEVIPEDSVKNSNDFLLKGVRVYG